MPDDEPSSTAVHAPPHEVRARGRKFSRFERYRVVDAGRERMSVGDLRAADRALGADFLLAIYPGLADPAKEHPPAFAICICCHWVS